MSMTCIRSLDYIHVHIIIDINFVSVPGFLDPHAVVCDVQVVHDVVWLSRVENAPHSQQTLQKFPSTYNKIK